MGANCTSCQTCNGEPEFNDATETPLNIRSSITALQKNSKQMYQQKTNTKYEGEMNYKANVKKIVKIQALYRGIKARRMYEIVSMTSKAQTKYFTEDESKETLQSKLFDMGNQKTYYKTYKYASGAVYQGEWLQSFRHGRGIMKWPDGAVYEGDWDYGMAFGQGKFQHIDGDIYEGHWSNNKANGKGVYVNAKGARYEGDWKDDQQHGIGIEKWHEGSEYEGGYSMGKKEGQGKYTWADGSTYSGDWIDNRINGQGVYLWKDGRKYYGEWLNNDMEGYGVYYWADGRRYEGQYHNDKKCGFGLYHWTDGRKYEGWWYKGKQHGLGTYLDPAKEKVKFGLWEGGKRIKWFDEEGIQQISRNQLDYTAFFTEPESRGTVKPNSSFYRPAGFDASLNSIKKKLNVPYEPNTGPLIQNI